MSFYQELSRYYDEIFAVGPGEMDFLRSRLTDCRNILDVGCGTGNKTELLAEPGRRILGLDLDPDMIRLADTYHPAEGITYQVGNMTEISRLAGAPFDGLICLGNTLVHLEPPLVNTFFTDAAAILKPGAVLAIQILNYDCIIDSGLSELPLIDTEHTTFSRHYDWEAGALHFRTHLEIKGGDSYDNDIILHPLRRAALLEAMSVGFGAAQFFGGYDGRPLAADSLVLIAIATRS
ncbi:hypothetical protein C4J81_02350 [Deltaproteobacteria bacterium Smac51]|nr:hypothetical protein C4J81_02350 [Deltaproteobacteria bacterium Smac51]